MDNKKIIQKTQSLLKEYGHEVKTGHLYEIFSKLSNESSWNVASNKNVSFKQKVISFFSKKESFLKNNEFKGIKDHFFLGKNSLGEDVFSNFYLLPNLINVGRMGTGKTESTKTGLYSWLLNNGDNSMIFIADAFGSSSEYKGFSNLDQVFLLKNESQLLSLIRLLDNELSSRKQEFEKVGASSIYDFEKITGKKITRLISVLERFESFSKILDFEEKINDKQSLAFKFYDLMRIGRFYGIWFIANSLKGTKDYIPTKIITCFSNKNIFRTNNRGESIYLLGNDNAWLIDNEERGHCYNDPRGEKLVFTQINEDDLLFLEKKINKFSSINLSVNFNDIFLGKK